MRGVRLHLNDVGRSFTLDLWRVALGARYCRLGGSLSIVALIASILDLVSIYNNCFLDLVQYSIQKHASHNVAKNVHAKICET